MPTIAPTEIIWSRTKNTQEIICSALGLQAMFSSFPYLRSIKMKCIALMRSCAFNLSILSKGIVE